MVESKAQTDQNERKEAATQASFVLTIQTTPIVYYQPLESRATRMTLVLS